MNADVRLRLVEPGDLPIFFEQQRDAGANHLAAFGAEDPNARDAFNAKWQKILDDPHLVARTILYQEKVAGNLGCHRWFGEPEVSYWLGREFWNKGVATAALTQLLTIVSERPVFARVVHDNIPSLRVLQKCGYVVTGTDRAFSRSRGAEVDELILRLD